jgi:hypothetical protein
VLSVTPTEFGTAGGETVTITGSNFRAGSIATANLNVTYGPEGYEYNAKDCALVGYNVGDSTANIECKTVAGYGLDHSWMVHINTIESPRFSCGNTGICSRFVSFCSCH